MEYVDRRGTQCEKWDALPQKFGEDGLLAMWVADMDFACPACVKQALHEYIERPLGYFPRLPRILTRWCAGRRSATALPCSPSGCA